MLKQREIDPEYERQVNKLLRYYLSTKYKFSKENKVVDVLSRVVGTLVIYNIMAIKVVDMNMILKEIEADTKL